MFVISWFEQLNDEGIVTSNEEVQIELLRGNDQFADWAATDPPIFEENNDAYMQARLSVEDATLFEAKEIGYSTNKVSDFFKGADTYVIAQAMVQSSCVVTNESPRQPGKIQIPQICERIGVRCTTTKGMIKELTPNITVTLRALLGNKI